MNKQQFLYAVRQRLGGLAESDIQRSLDYYAEMIDDRMEDGLSEQEAVAAMGSPEYVASQILMATPLPKLVKAKVKDRAGMPTWQILLLILGSPVWLPLLLGVGIAVFSVYIAIWAIVVSLFAVVFSLGLSGICSIISGIGALCFGAIDAHMALLLAAAGLILTGVTILLTLTMIQVAKGIFAISKRIVLEIKSLFIRKGAEK